MFLEELFHGKAEPVIGASDNCTSLSSTRKGQQLIALASNDILISTNLIFIG